MSLHEQTAFSRRFHQQLDRIRAKIEALPEDLRPYFRSLADQAAEHHRSMESECARVRGLIDDMRLNEATVRFDLWSASENIRRALTTPPSRSTGARSWR